MRVKRITAAGRERSANPIFRGTVESQTAVGEEDSRDLRLSEVAFKDGGRNTWHMHSCDQILVVTSGSGMVATEHEQRDINVGDVVHIKAGERHWHGAKASSTMGHITITLVGGQATWG